MKRKTKQMTKTTHKAMVALRPKRLAGRRKSSALGHDETFDESRLDSRQRAELAAELAAGIAEARAGLEIPAEEVLEESEGA